MQSTSHARSRAIRSSAAALLLCIAAGRPSRLRAQQAAIPTPESTFGHPVGADYKLIDYDQSIAYFRKLAAASNRIRLIEVGKTSFGRPWTVALISSPKNLARLDRYRGINMRLAHPEGLTDAQARTLARSGRAIVDISGGLHASEIAGSQHTPQLAYELLSRANEPAYREIFDNVILFLWPSINPDGQDIVVNWCRARDEGKNPGPMELYQKYIGHDNNRDSYMLNVIESRVIQRTWREWEPDIIYVHHQSSPFPTRIWIPPFADPIGLRAPAIMGREVNAIGTRIASELDANGQPGAVHMLETYDAWYPGYIDYMPMYQNIPAWWTETQGGNCATPRTTTLDSLPRAYKDLRPTAMYVSPWAQGKWGLRDAVDYMVTASRATLSYAAKFREEVLYNRYQAGRNTIRQYRTSPPYAYIVPQAQVDPVAPVELLRRLAFMGINVRQLDRDITYDGAVYPKGTWVIPMDQEYAQLVRELFEPQKYPDLGEDTPYDAAGWTLPYQMNVNVVEGRIPLSDDFRAALKPVQGKAERWGASAEYPFTTNATAAGIVPPPAKLTGSGARLLLDPAQNNSFRLIGRALAGGGMLEYVPASTATSGKYVVSGVDSSKLERWANELWVSGERTGAATAAGPSNESHTVKAPARIGLFKAAPGNMDQGWTEWLLESFGLPYSLVTPADLRARSLSSRFDVIILASQGLTSARGGRGRGGGGGGGGAGGRGAVAAGNPADSGARAIPDSIRLRAVEDSARVRAVDEFVRGGGTVVAWTTGATAAINTLRLPVRNVVEGLNRQEYFTGISIMRVTTDATHPVMAGMPAQADVVVNNSPVFTTLDGFEGSIIAKYPSDVTPLRSGFLNGVELMQGYAAAVDVKRDRGHVILLGFQPQWRGQPTGTFRVVFNSAFYARDVADQTKVNPGFWSAPAPKRPVSSDSAQAGAWGRRGGPPGEPRR